MTIGSIYARSSAGTVVFGVVMSAASCAMRARFSGVAHMRAPGKIKP